MSCFILNYLCTSIFKINSIRQLRYVNPSPAFPLCYTKTLAVNINGKKCVHNEAGAGTTYYTLQPNKPPLPLFKHTIIPEPNLLKQFTNLIKIISHMRRLMPIGTYSNNFTTKFLITF